MKHDCVKKFFAGFSLSLTLLRDLSGFVMPSLSLSCLFAVCHPERSEGSLYG